MKRGLAMDALLSKSSQDQFSKMVTYIYDVTDVDIRGIPR